MKFNDLARDFIENSDAILPSKWNEYQALLTVLLALTCMYHSDFFMLLSVFIVPLLLIVY